MITLKELNLQCYTPFWQSSRVNVCIVLAYGGMNGFSSTHPGFVKFRKALLRKGCTVVTFDYRRHQNANLLSRYEDLLYALHFVRERFPTHHAVPFGHSMGGALVARLCGDTNESTEIDGAILCCPAAYHPDAWRVPFGSKFTQILRTEESWRCSEEYHSFQASSRPKLVFFSAKDTVVPEEIVQGYLYNHSVWPRQVPLPYPEEHKIFGAPPHIQAKKTQVILSEISRFAGEITASCYVGLKPIYPLHSDRAL